MRLTIWNYCWKLEQKLPALLNEAPDIAVVQECSQAFLQNLPDGYRGQWLHGTPNHGLGLIYREAYIPQTSPRQTSPPSFAPTSPAFRHIAARLTPPRDASYRRPPGTTSSTHWRHAKPGIHDEQLEDKQQGAQGPLLTQSPLAEKRRRKATLFPNLCGERGHLRQMSQQH